MLRTIQLGRVNKTLLNQAPVDVLRGLGATMKRRVGRWPVGSPEDGSDMELQLVMYR